MVYFQSLLAISCLVGCSDTKNLTEIARNEVAQAVLDEQLALANFNSEVLSVNGLVKSQDAVPIQNAEVTSLGDASADLRVLPAVTRLTVYRRPYVLHICRNFRKVDVSEITYRILQECFGIIRDILDAS